MTPRWEMMISSGTPQARITNRRNTNLGVKTVSEGPGECRQGSQGGGRLGHLRSHPLPERGQGGTEARREPPQGRGGTGAGRDSC